MAIGTGQALLLEELVKRGAWKAIDTVCELGSQTPIPEELADMFAAFGKAPLGGQYGAADLYEDLGISGYTCIDINGLHDSLQFDLNRCLKAEYGFVESFDLVTNFGTTSVLFNQFEAFRSIHEMCNSGGYMIHTLPSQGWGGQWFFRYDPSFVRDLAKANNYDVLLLKAFLRIKPYLRKNRIAGIAKIRALCDFVESRVEAETAGAGDRESADVLARRAIASSTETEAAVQEVGLGSALFDISLACILRKTGNDEFSTPLLSMYEGQNRLALSAIRLKHRLARSKWRKSFGRREPQSGQLSAGPSSSSTDLDSSG